MSHPSPLRVNADLLRPLLVTSWRFYLLVALFGGVVLTALVSWLSQAFLGFGVTGFRWSPESDLETEMTRLTEQYALSGVELMFSDRVHPGGPRPQSHPDQDSEDTPLRRIDVAIHSGGDLLG